jgi:hypothetical protein
MKVTFPILATLVATSVALPNAAPVEADVANTNAPDAAEGTVFKAAQCFGRANKSTTLLTRRHKLITTREMRPQGPESA